MYFACLFLSYHGFFPPRLRRPAGQGWQRGTAGDGYEFLMRFRGRSARDQRSWKVRRGRTPEVKVCTLRVSDHEEDTFRGSDSWTKTGCRADNCPGPCARTLNGDMPSDMQKMIKKMLSEETIFRSKDNDVQIKIKYSSK